MATPLSTSLDGIESDNMATPLSTSLDGIGSNVLATPLSTSLDGIGSNVLATPLSTSLDGIGSNVLATPLSTSLDGIGSNVLATPLSTSLDGIGSNVLATPLSTSLDGIGSEDMATPLSTSLDGIGSNVLATPLNTSLDGIGSEVLATPLSTSLDGIGSDVFDEQSPMCEPCSVEEQEIPADRFCVDCQEYLCTKCSKYHISLKMSRTHTLLTLKEVNKEAKSAKKDKCSEKCTTHEDKTIKWFCEVHSSLGCNVCIDTSHKQCNNTLYIPTAAADIANNDAFKTFDGNLRALDRAFKASIKDVKNVLEQIEGDEVKLKNAFETFRKRLNEVVDKLENDTTSYVRTIRQEETSKLKTLNKGLESSMNEVSVLVEDIDALLKTGKHCDAYVAMKKKEANLVRLNDELEGLTRGKNYRRYEFRPNEDILQHETLGKLNTVKANIDWRAPTVPELKPRQAGLALEKNADTESDSSSDYEDCNQDIAEWEPTPQDMNVGVESEPSMLKTMTDSVGQRDCNQDIAELETTPQDMNVGGESEPPLLKTMTDSVSQRDCNQDIAEWETTPQDINVGGESEPPMLKTMTDNVGQRDCETSPKNIDWAVMAQKMKVGDRVRRGRDWQEGHNEDGGGLGTIIRDAGTSKVVWNIPRWKVRWDSGDSGIYLMGQGQSGRFARRSRYHESYQLEIVCTESKC